MDRLEDDKLNKLDNYVPRDVIDTPDTELPVVDNRDTTGYRPTSDVAADKNVGYIPAPLDNRYRPTSDVAADKNVGYVPSSQRFTSPVITRHMEDDSVKANTPWSPVNTPPVSNSLLDRQAAANSLDIKDVPKQEGKYTTASGEAKYDPTKLSWTDKLKAAAEYDAAKTGDKPNLMRTLWKSMGKDISQLDNPYAQQMKKDQDNGVRSALDLTEAFAKGYTHDTSATALDKRQAQTNLENQAKAAKEEAAAGRKFGASEREASQTFTSGENKASRDAAQTQFESQLSEAQASRTQSGNQFDAQLSQAAKLSSDQLAQAKTLDEQNRILTAAQNDANRELQKYLSTEQNSTQRSIAKVNYYTSIMQLNAQLGRDPKLSLPNLDPSAPGAAEEIAAIEAAKNNYQAAATKASGSAASAIGATPQPVGPPPAKPASKPVLSADQAATAAGYVSMPGDYYKDASGKFYRWDVTNQTWKEKI